MPLVSVRGLTVHYGPVVALDAVDLAVEAGELVALAGENGAGKTTLVRCLVGDLAPHAGEVRVAGELVRSGPGTPKRHGLAVVWQDLALCDNLDVAANLFLGEEPGGPVLSEVALHAAAKKLLLSLGVRLETTRPVWSLSGGQRQVLAVARAVLRRPRLLVLDEPTAALGVAEARRVERLIGELHRSGSTILLVTHDVEQMYRLATRIVVLCHGRVVGSVHPSEVHPDEVVALVSGQPIDSSARRQLSRLQGLAGQLASAAPSSSLSLIASALGPALGTGKVAIHLVEGGELRCAAAVGLPRGLETAWSALPIGPGGGPPGAAVARAAVVIDRDVATSPSWERHREEALAAGIRSSLAVPVMSAEGVEGVITVLRAVDTPPRRDELDVLGLYAGYVAGAAERDRLLGELTRRNRLLETIREVLETLAGPAPVTTALHAALRTLRRGLRAEEVGLWTLRPGGEPTCRGVVGDAFRGDGEQGAGASTKRLEAVARRVLGKGSWEPGTTVEPVESGVFSASSGFSVGSGRAVLLASFRGDGVGEDALALLEDAAHSLCLALEREEAETAHREAAALRRSRELQRRFLSLLSHELRTPLTAICGYASSLLQPDVAWDEESERRFVGRIAAESARLSRLVDDLLDFSRIESGTLRLSPDWCDVSLVLEAAVACLPPSCASAVRIVCAPDLPPVWADHDRLEQVFVNLLDNAVRHNPPGTHVSVEASVAEGGVVVEVADDGVGLDRAGGEGAGQGRTVSRPRNPKGAGLGLSIARGIVEAHGGRMEIRPREPGTACRVWLSLDAPAELSDPGEAFEQARCP